MKTELGQIIGIVIRQQKNYWKLYVLKGSLKTGEETYKTCTNTVNIKICDDCEVDLNKDYIGNIIKCSIIDDYITGAKYSFKKGGTGYKVNILSILENSLNLDY